MANVNFLNVSKRFGKTEVVHKINLDIEDGEFVVLVGPSGCGKSTTLRMAAGLEKISDGKVLIGNRVVNNVPPKDRGVAMVFQNYALYPHMTVYENISFGLKLSKTPKAEIDKKVKEASEILGITELLDRKSKALSGGQRQRVAMGRAIVREPELFLFDEPLSNLDAKLRTQMRIEIKKIHQRVKSTVMYVTHDQVEAMTLGDRIVVMQDGNIEQEGTPMDLFQHPRNTFVAGFIGNPPMNLVEATIAGTGPSHRLVFTGGLDLPIPEGKFGRIEEGREVIMGLRPEDIKVLNGGEDGAYPEEWITDGNVEVSEPLGSETSLHVDVKQTQLVARSQGRQTIKVGDRVKLAADLNHLHIFDVKTKRALA